MVFVSGVGNVEFFDNLGGTLALDDEGKFYTEWPDVAPAAGPYTEEDADEAHEELLGGVSEHRYDAPLGRRESGAASYLETSEAGDRGHGDGLVDHIKPTDTTLARIESGELDEDVPLRTTSSRYQAFQQNLPWLKWLSPIGAASGVLGGATSLEDREKHLPTAYRPESVQTSEFSTGSFAGSGGLSDEEMRAMQVTRSMDIAVAGGAAPKEGDEGWDQWQEDYARNSEIAEKAYGRWQGDTAAAAGAGMDLADYREDERLQREAEGRSEGLGWVAPVYYGFEDLGNTLRSDAYRFASTVEWIGGDMGLDEQANELQRMKNLEEQVRGKGREGGGETYGERTYRQAGTELTKYVTLGLLVGGLTRNPKAAEKAVMAFAASESFNQQYVESIDNGHSKKEAALHGSVKAGFTAVAMAAGNRLGAKYGMGPMEFAGVNTVRRLLGREAGETALDLSTRSLTRAVTDFTFSVAKGGVGEVLEETADMTMGAVYDRLAYNVAGRELGAGAEDNQGEIWVNNFLELLGPSLAGGGAGKLMPGNEAWDAASSGVRAIRESVDENYRNMENELVGRRQANRDIAERLGIVPEGERGVDYDELHHTILDNLKSTDPEIRESTLDALRELEDMRLPEKPSRKDFTDKTGRKESSRSQREGYDQEVATVLRHGEAFEHIFEERSYEEVMEDVVATHPDLVEEYAERKAAIEESDDAVERREQLMEELEVMQEENPELADSLREAALAHIKETAPSPEAEVAAPTKTTIPATNRAGETEDADVVVWNSRKVKLVDVNGTIVPYYLSTGRADKEASGVPAGKWYPFFGINSGKDGGWINKGDVGSIANYYNSPSLRAAGENLDNTVGDIRDSDVGVKLISGRRAGKDYAQGTRDTLDYINRAAGIEPLTSAESETEAGKSKLRENIRTISEAVERAAVVKKAAASRPASKPTPKTKKASAGVGLTIQEQIKQQARPVEDPREHRDDMVAIQKAIPGAQVEQINIVGEDAPSGGYRAYRWVLNPTRKKKGERLKENTGVIMWATDETMAVAMDERNKRLLLGIGVSQESLETYRKYADFTLNTGRITLDGLGVIRLGSALEQGDAGLEVGGKGLVLGVEEGLRHELVHLARAAGLFTDEEWSGFVKKYSDSSKNELEQEEAIAKASALWQRDSGFHSKLRQFIRKIIKAMHGLVGREYNEVARDEVAALEQAFLNGEVLKRNRIAEDNELIARWKGKLAEAREEGKRQAEEMPEDTPASDVPTEVIVATAADVVAGRDLDPKVQQIMFNEPEVMEARIENAAEEMSNPSPEPEATDAPFDVETMEDLLASGSYLHPRANLDKKPPKRRRESSGRKFHAEIMDMLTRGIETGEAIEKGFPNAAKKMRSAGFEPQEVVDYVNHQRAEGRSQHDWEAVPYEAPPKLRVPERVEVASLSKGLSSAKPRYNMGSKSYQPRFASDVDLALYIVAKSGSKRDADYMKWLKEVFPGRGVTEIRELGAGVRQHLRSVAQESEPGAIDIPESRISMDTHPDLDDSVGMAEYDDSVAMSEYAPRRKRVKSGESRGQYIGAPKGIDTPGKLATILNRVRRLAEEGVYGRFWYERSGRSILEFVHGDKQEAEKVVAAIAVTSPNTPVDSNFTFALQAYTQWKAGREIRTGKFPTAMSAKLKGIFGGEDWAGRKTNEFYGNLMRVIDPSRVQGVTTDIWMQRAFGHYQDSPTDAQYTFSENEVKRIADKLGWEPQQVQAAAWVAMKSRMENSEVKAATNKESLKNGYIKFSGPKKELKILNGEAHRRVWYKHALKHRPTDKDRGAAKFDYKDAADHNNAQISYESIPGQTSSHLPEMFNAPMQQQIEYHAATLKAFLDDDGYDIIAKEFGIVSPGRFEAPGYFEGKVSPGSQMEVIAPRQYGVSNKLDAARKALDDRVRAEGRKKTPEEAALLNSQLRDIRYKVEPAVEDLISVYSAVVGTLLKQDGMGWHRPWFDDSVAKRDLNGVEVRIGRPFTEAETARLAKILVDVTGHEDYNPIGAEGGVRIINFDYLGVENQEFQSQVAKALESMEFEDNVEYVSAPFAAQTGYFENNWKENPNGERYLDRALGGRPDLQRRVRTIIEEIQPRIDAIDAEFATKYGWTRNEQINSAHRRGDSDVEGRLALQQEDSVALMGFDSIADMLRAGVKFFSGSKPEEVAEAPKAKTTKPASPLPPVPAGTEGRVVADTHVSPGRTPETKAEIKEVQRRISVPVHDTTFTEEMAAEDARINDDYEGELASLLAEIDTVRAEVESGLGSMAKLTESAEQNFRFQALMEEATRRMIAAKSGDEWTDGGQAYDILEKLTLAYAEGGSEIGRALVSRRAIDPSLSPAARREKELLAIVASLIKEKASKNPGKSKNATDVLNKLAKQDFDINDIAGIAADPMRSIEFLNQVRAASASWHDAVYEYWRNSLLSGFQTQAVNMAGTAGFMTYVSMFERAASAGVGTVTRRSAGYDAATFREFGWMFHGMGDAFKNAFRNMSMTFRAERSEFDALNHQSHKVRDYYSGQKGGAIAAGSPKISGRLGKMVRMMGFRPAAAVDDLLKTLAQHFETNALAARIAAVDSGQKWGSEEFLRIFNEQLLHPNSTARRLATERAMTGAFQGDEGLLMRRFGGLSEKFHQQGFTRWFHPFHKTPLNITDEAIRRAPVLGFVVDVLNYRNRRSKSESEHGFWRGYAEDGLTDSLARQAIALTVSALVLSMNDEEEPFITGAGGTLDPKERQLAYGSGYAPMTIGIGGGYRVSYARVEPLATILGPLVDTHRSVVRGDNVANAVVSSGMNQLNDKTFLRGMSDLVQLQQNWVRKGGANALMNWSSNFASSWVPNMYRQASREFGGTIDETRLWGKGSALKVLKRTGQKAELPFVEAPRPRYDQWGRPVTKRPFGKSPITDVPYGILRALNPARVYSMDQATKVDLAMYRYNATRPADERIYLTTPRKSYTHLGETHHLTDAQWAQYQKYVGTYALKSIDGIGWIDPENPTEAQMEAVKKLYSKAAGDIKKALKWQWINGDDGSIPSLD